MINMYNCYDCKFKSTCAQSEPCKSCIKDRYVKGEDYKQYSNWTREDKEDKEKLQEGHSYQLFTKVCGVKLYLHLVYNYNRDEDETFELENGQRADLVNSGNIRYTDNFDKMIKIQNFLLKEYNQVFFMEEA